MHYHRLIVFTFLVCLAFAQVNSSAEKTNDQLNVDAIDNYITEKMQLPRIPGIALAIVKDDKIIYLKAYGEADSSGRPVTPQTPFIIGSITKSFTALAVLQLVDSGQVELDAPVQRYIPWFRVADPHASSQITVRQLINQTSGLPMIREPQMWTDFDDKALERAVRLLENANLNAAPGEAFAYSNANFNTLGLIVQTVSGKSYEEYVKEHIFAPLDMQHSFVSQDEARKDGMAHGHRWWFGIPVEKAFPYSRAELPAGYILSSAEDMAHFMIAQMNGGRYEDASILSPELIAATHRAAAAKSVAMGWESAQSNGHTLINHDGGTANFQSSLFFDPQERVGVFVAANVMSALDAFSSPHGRNLVDGPTVRGMAQTVLSMAADRPLPDQGRGKTRLYLIFDLVLLALTVWLVIALLRIPRRYRRLTEHGISTRKDFTWRIGLIALLHFVWPLVVLYVAVNVFMWNVLFMFQPDLVYWLQVVAAIVFLKGILEITLLRRVLRPGYE